MKSFTAVKLIIALFVIGAIGYLGMQIFSASSFDTGAIGEETKKLLSADDQPANLNDKATTNTLDYDSLSVIAPKGVIVTQIADTEQKMELGLGQRDSLPSKSGMIFSFSEPGSYGFWMKDMRFPLTILWLDQNKKVVSMNSHVSVDSFPNLLYPTKKVSYVIEINAGEESSLGISTGTVLKF